VEASICAPGIICESGLTKRWSEPLDESMTQLMVISYLFSGFSCAPSSGG
jgi:hypothetical protein